MADYRDLHISIIGAGMGGLAAALAFGRKGFKQIDVYEQAPGLGFVGAGIQIAPNMIRVLDRLGIWTGSALQNEATRVSTVAIHDGPTNKVLAEVQMTDIAQKYGYAHHAGHRASLAGGLYEAAKKEPNVHFHFGMSLLRVDSFGPEKVRFVIKTQDGTEQSVQADVLIGADGIKSQLKESILSALKLSAEVEETGTAAYRILLTQGQMKQDPELLQLLESDTVRRWIGSKRHVIAYPIHNHTIYNIATAHPDVNFAGPTNSTWTNLSDKGAMMSVYDDFCPLVKKLLSLAPEGDVVEWRLRSYKPLESWTNGCVALLGDACHPTLPHLSQGAAMAIEDAASLAEVLSMVPSGGVNHKDIEKYLKTYELLRKTRTSTLVDLAALSARTLHLGEGEAKEERDRQFEAAKSKGAPVPDKWASPDVQEMMYEYDCIKDTHQRFKEVYSKL